MKIAIVFYSFSGNTRTACEFLKENLEAKSGFVAMVQLKLKQEVTAFLKQCFQARSKKTPLFCAVDIDLKDYDFIVFASPVWAFSIAPALRAYLKAIGDLEGKKTGCFLTYGSGVGKGKALSELENILREKKAHILFSRNIRGKEVNDKSCLEKEFKSLFEIVTV